jgi:hypothetical protein
MAGNLGLKNSLRERVISPLTNYRDGEKGGKEISFLKFAQTRALDESGKPVGLKNTSGNPVTWDDIWCDLGLDPSQVSLDNLLTTSGDVRYLAPEIVRDFILKGMESDSTYLDLVAGVESVDQMVVTSPWIQMANEGPEEIGEAETIPLASMTWGHKTIELNKRAKAIQFSDELLLRVKLPLLSYFLRKFGVMLSADLYTEAATTMVNGDQADSSDTCAVVGVADTGAGIAFKDFLRAWIRARRISMSWSSLITTETGAWDILQLSEFSDQKGVGGVEVNVESRNRIIPANMPHLISSAITDDQVMLFDKSQALLFLVFRPLLVESERIIMRQISGTACSIICGWATIDRNARIILDGAKAFSGYGFPSYMAPLV